MKMSEFEMKRSRDDNLGIKCATVS